MRILIDGDGFPNINDIVNLAKKYNKEIVIYKDDTHNILVDAKIITVDKSSNSADLHIENDVKKGDLVLTNDYGVSLIALSKNAYVVNSNGFEYEEDKIDILIDIKNINAKYRKKGRVKGPKKREEKDIKNLLSKVEQIIGGCSND